MRIKIRIVANMIAAICWTFLAIFSFVENQSVYSKGIYTVCAIIWIFLTYTSLKDYFDSKK